MNSVAQRFMARAKALKEPMPLVSVAEESAGSTAMSTGDIGDYAYAEELAEYNRKKQDPDFLDLDEEVEFDEDALDDVMASFADEFAKLDDDMEYDEIDRLISTTKLAERALVGLQGKKELPTESERLNPHATLGDIISREIGNYKVTKKGEVKGDDTRVTENTPEDAWEADSDYEVVMSGSLTNDYVGVQDDIFGTYGDKAVTKMTRMIEAVDASNGKLVGVWNPVARVIMTQGIEEYEEDENTIMVYTNTEFGGDTMVEEDYETIVVDGFVIAEEAVTPSQKSVKKPKAGAKKKKPATIAQLVNNKRKASIRFKRMAGRMKARREASIHKTDLGTLRKRAWKQFINNIHASLAKKMFKVTDPKELPLQKQVQLDQIVKRKLPVMQKKFQKFLANYLKQARGGGANGKEK